MTLEGPSRPEVDAEGRRRVSVQDGQLMPAHQVASAIIVNFKKFLHPTEEGIKEWFWDPAEDDAVWAAWSVKASELYKDMVYGFKRNKIKGCPPYVPPEMWEGFKAHWDSDAFKKKSEVLSKNCLSEPDGPGTGIVKHRGGSRSAVAHAGTLSAALQEKMDAQTALLQAQQEQIRQQQEIIELMMAQFGGPPPSSSS
ncbi:hypothetical protein C2S51_029400 [Perilla frutescens var. frutescens]|nr:hypothetical protein C2S51_029400 [Perilla frutescens var. frutescens]